MRLSRRLMLANQAQVGGVLEHLNDAAVAIESTSLGFYGIDAWAIQPGDLLIFLGITKDTAMAPAQSGWTLINSGLGRSIYTRVCDGAETFMSTVPDANAGRAGILYHFRGAGGVSYAGPTSGVNPPSKTMSVDSIALACVMSKYYGIAADTAPVGYAIDRRPTAGSGYSRMAVASAQKTTAPNTTEDPGAFGGASGNEHWSYTIEVAKA